MIECPDCGAIYDHVRKFNSGNPTWVWLPTCTCGEDALYEQLKQRFRDLPWWYGG